MNDLYFERKFYLWFYQISHSEVIIRSPKNEEDGLYNNIDIYIGAVDYLELPCQFHGLRIKEATKGDVDYISSRLGKRVPEKKIIVLISENQKYYIVAPFYKILENNLKEDELPIHYWSGVTVDTDSSIQEIDKKEINQYDREYKFWFYQVFHQEAVIRAPIFGLDKKYKNTIEIKVSNSKYLEIPIFIHSLKIGDTTEADINYINKKMSENLSKDKILVLLSGNMRYYIVSGNEEFIKSNMEHYQDSIKTPFHN